MADSEIRTRHLQLPNCGDPNICFIQDTSSGDLNSARHGQFQKKEKTPTTELNIFLSKFSQNKEKHSMQNAFQ